MEQQENAVIVTPRSAGIRYGLIGAVISIAFFVILNVAGVDMSTGGGGWQYLGWVITAVLIFLAQKYYKESGDGFMAYGQGIGIAFWLGLVSGAISSVFTFIYVQFIDNTFLEKMKDAQLAEFEKQNMSEAQIEQAMKFAGMFTTPTAMLVIGLIASVVLALIIGLIVTIFTQKKSPETTF